jgi:hypothetical protein
MLRSLGDERASNVKRGVRQILVPPGSHAVGLILRGWKVNRS